MTHDTDKTGQPSQVILPGAQAETMPSEQVAQANHVAQHQTSWQSPKADHEDLGDQSPELEATSQTIAEELPPTTPAIPMISKDSYDAVVTQLTAFESKLDNTLRQYKEAKEDFEATKRRMQRDLHKERHNIKKAVLLPLLDTMDDLQRALSAPISNQPEATALHQGIEMVKNRFLKTLEGQGVSLVALAGELFDPNLCEAASMVPVQDQQQDSVIMAVIRPCYLLGEEVLRSGMVIVGKHHPQGLEVPTNNSSEQLNATNSLESNPVPEQNTSSPANA